MRKARWAMLVLTGLAVLGLAFRYQQLAADISATPITGPSQNIFIQSPAWQQSPEARAEHLTFLRNRYLTYMAAVVLLGLLAFVATTDPWEGRYSASRDPQR